MSYLATRQAAVSVIQSTTSSLRSSHRQASSGLLLGSRVNSFPSPSFRKANFKVSLVMGGLASKTAETAATTSAQLLTSPPSAASCKEKLQRAFPYVLLSSAAYRPDPSDRENPTETFEACFQRLTKKYQSTVGGGWTIEKSEQLDMSSELWIGATDTNVYVAKVTRGDGKKELVIVFRGTQNPKTAQGISDWATNLSFFMTPLQLWGGKDVAFKPGFWTTVHAGFADSFKDVTCTSDEEGLRHPTTNLKDAIERIMGETAYDSVVCCGHSLGGALATLGALWCAKVAYGTQLPPGKRKPDIACITIGSPRVGGGYFAQLFNKEVPDSTRIVNQWDPVPGVPLPLWPFFPYKHVGGSVWITTGSSGKLEALENTRPFSWRFARNALHVQMHFGDQYEEAMLEALAYTPLREQ